MQFYELHCRKPLLSKIVTFHCFLSKLLQSGPLSGFPLASAKRNVQFVLVCAKIVFVPYTFYLFDNENINRTNINWARLDFAVCHAINFRNLVF